MTFSPIISTAGTVPDSAAADPAGTAADPAVAAPDPAAVPDPGTGPGQPTEAATEPNFAGPAAGQAASYAGPATGHADPAAGHPGPAAGHADPAAGHPGPADPATGQAGGFPAGHEGYSGGRAGSTAGQGSYSAGYAGSSAEAADSASGTGHQDEAGVAWPHQTYLELGALPTAAPCARLHSTLVLWEWELGALVCTAGLVVSELVSNAVQASVGLTGSRFSGHWAPGTPPVRVWLSADDHRVVIQVWDGSDRPPVPQPVEPEADSGRGLLLVGALSSEWGCYTPEKSSGKVVWAVVTG